MDASACSTSARALDIKPRFSRSWRARSSPLNAGPSSPTRRASGLTRLVIATCASSSATAAWGMWTTRRTTASSSPRHRRACRSRSSISSPTADASSSLSVRLIGTRGEELFKTWHPDSVITDMMLPDVDGIELVRKFKQIDPEAEVIVITGQGNIPRSVEAVKAGAFDFLEKPVDAERLLDKLEKAIKQKTLIDENEQLKAKLQDRYKFQNVIGKSKKMQELFELIESVAASEANILIQGENGTGKELIANAIHYNSKRSKGPFIKINCAAIPKDLIESELFGYKKGAFTGATMDKEGLFEMAEGGSLLLDEIGEMPPYLQTKLLRVLQEREYRPIGSDRIVHVDFRLICATNIDLDTALRDGRLREDLYFRINTITLRVPPLRERTEDIPLLCDFFLDKFRQRHQKNVKTLAPPVYHLP